MASRAWKQIRGMMTTKKYPKEIVPGLLFNDELFKDLNFDEFEKALKIISKTVRIRAESKKKLLYEDEEW